MTGEIPVELPANLVKLSQPVDRGDTGRTGPFDESDGAVSVWKPADRVRAGQLARCSGQRLCPAWAVLLHIAGPANHSGTTNRNGKIDRSEVIKAINDYLSGEGDTITRAEVIRLINLYLVGPQAAQQSEASEEPGGGQPADADRPVVESVPQ